MELATYVQPPVSGLHIGKLAALEVVVTDGPTSQACSGHDDGPHGLLEWIIEKSQYLFIYIYLYILGILIIRYGNPYHWFVLFGVSGVGEMKFSDFSDFAATKNTSCGCLKTGYGLR